jgi:hypothetical protein
VRLEVVGQSWRRRLVRGHQQGFGFDMAIGGSSRWIAPAPDGEGGDERGDQAGDGHTGRDESASHVVVIARVAWGAGSVAHDAIPRRCGAIIRTVNDEQRRP